MTQIEVLNLLQYVDDVSKDDIGTMNVDHQKTNKEIQYHQKTP